MMEIDTKDYADTENFLFRYIELKANEKHLKEEIKSLKQEFKEEGVNVKVAIKIAEVLINKATLEDQKSQKSHEDVIKDWLQSDNEIGILSPR